MKKLAFKCEYCKKEFISAEYTQIFSVKLSKNIKVAVHPDCGYPCKNDK